jgi:DNA-binding transcriptional MerR regulator
MDQSNSYFTISDLAKELDVKKSHIRFCEENGLISPRASKLKRRAYNRYDRERLKLVFHFVLLGYSKEQIIGLIGIPDSNLDENDQLMQGIEYASKELRKLEKRKEELSFTKQTRTINEIEMLREYINKIKSIKSGVLEELSARPSIRFEEKTKIPTKPITAITAEAQKKNSTTSCQSDFFIRCRVSTGHPYRQLFLLSSRPKGNENHKTGSEETEPFWKNSRTSSV